MDEFSKMNTCDIDVFSQIENCEMDRIYNRLLYQQGSAFICVVVNRSNFHIKIAEKLINRLPEKTAQIIDFSKTVGFSYSSTNLKALLRQGARYIFLVNFQLAAGDLPDKAFLSVLNMSRDALADMPVVFIFMMPKYLFSQITLNAKDFTSFFTLHVEFFINDTYENINSINITDRFSEVKQELLQYYVEKYNDLADCKSKTAFFVIVKILYLNSDIRTLCYLVVKSFYKLFTELLQIYQEAPDINPEEIAYIYINMGGYVKALEWNLKDLASNETITGEQNLSTAAIFNNIALVYTRKGDYPNALEWYQKSLAINEIILGTECLETASTYSNIASVYDNQGAYTKALEMYQKALSINKKILGCEHASIAKLYNNIATVYDNQGDYPKALEWCQKSLSIYENILGAEQTSTAVVLNNMAMIYKNKGDYAKALDLCQKALIIDEKALGTEHPDTATIYNNMAVIFVDQGDYPQALEWFQKALTINEKMLGADHPSTDIVKRNIAHVVENIHNNKS